MRKLLGSSAFALGLVLAASTPAPLVAKDEPKEAVASKEADAKKAAAAMEAFEKGLHPQTGDVRIAEAKAVLHLGDQYYFLPAADAKRVLTEVWGNPPEAVSDVLGMVMLKDARVFDNAWGAVITYESTGHVSDADASSQDYAQVLADMKEGEAERNSQRKAAGYPTMELIGWAQAPSYDAANHSLIWAKDLKTEGQEVHDLNYDVRMLGRTGVLSVNMVWNMDKIGEVRTAAQALARSATFEKGAAYTDFDASVDKSAEYGLAGLVAGGAAVAVAKKVGLLAILLKFGKVILIGLAAFGAAIFAFFRRIMGRKNEDDEGTI